MQAVSKMRPEEEDEEGKELEKYLQEESNYKLTCIPKNTEKYTSFSLGQLRFIDSAQFLLATLDKLVSPNKPKALQIMACYEPKHQERELLMRKGVYPYEHMDSW